MVLVILESLNIEFCKIPKLFQEIHSQFNFRFA